MYKVLFKANSLIEKRTLLIFDTSWLAHAALLAKAYDWMVFNEKPSGHIYGSLSKILSMFRVYGGNDLNTTELVFVFDEYPEDTYAIYPEYKGYRQRNFDPLPDVKKMLSMFNCYTARADKTEADHVIASLVEKYHTSATIYVISADRDLWQLMDRPSVFITSKTKEILGIDSMKDKFKIDSPCQLALHKAIFGDPSDNIPKIQGRLCHKTIIKYIGMSDGYPESFYEVIENAKTDIKEDLYKSLIDGREQVEIMYGITKINCYAKYESTKNSVDSKNNLLDYLHSFGVFNFDDKLDVLFY